ncbi:MAG: hypothetical protein PVF70_02210 [Anaerolineales bacterium]
MNKIVFKRLVLAGLVTFLVFVAVELVVEVLIGEVVFEGALEQYHQTLAVPQWGAANKALNYLIAIVNTSMLIWLYAALRPMFGVGTKTALIASGFMLLFVSAFAINSANLGSYPPRIALIELGYQVLELPIALLVGAQVYEGSILT